MTKDGSFRRAARARARESGQKYTAVRAAMESGERRWTWSAPAFSHDALKAHLEHHYKIRVTSMAGFDAHHPATLWAERADGAPWVVRVFTMTTGLFKRLEGDAEILRWLEAHGYPAERLAHREPVTVLDELGVVVSEYVPGRRPIASPVVQHTLGDLLGRLHVLPPAKGAMARDGGSFDHDASHIGRPAADIAASMHALRSVESGVDRTHHDAFEWLVEQVASAEDCEGLPEAFTHGNYGPFNAVQRPDGDITVVAWAASGRAPRLATLGWHLYTTGGDPQQIDAIVAGYAKRVRLTDDELERLAGAMFMRDLYLASWYYRAAVSKGTTPSGDEGWWPDREHAELIASRAVAAFREGRQRTTTESKNDRDEEPTVIEEYGKSAQATVVDRYRRSADAFEALIAGTPPDRWEDPSPCAAWSARDVVAHVVGHSTGILQERGVEVTAAPPVEVDPLAAFDAIRSDVERVLADPTITSQSVNWLDAALSFDLPQHGWDLAKATGQDATMDAELLRAQWETASRMAPAVWAWQRDQRHYGPEVPVPEDAPVQERLLGLLGRDPDWAPPS